MLDEGTEDFYAFPDNWDVDDEEEVEVDVDLKKMVIVDASVFHRNILKGHLEAAGYKVAGMVGSAAEAGKIMEESKARMAAVDYDQTDGGNGRALQLIAAVYPQAVYLVTSGKFKAGQEGQSGTGKIYCLGKPFEKDRVIEFMKKVYDTEFARKKAARTPAGGNTAPAPPA